MIYSKQLPGNLFLFYLQHTPFVSGEIKRPSSTMTANKAVQYFARLFTTVALPLTILLAVLVAITGRSIAFLLAVELIMAALTCAFVAFMSYRYDASLLEHGSIVIGEIISSETKPRFGPTGHSKVTHVHYRFATPDNKKVIRSIQLDYAQQRLPDGRKYPTVGTKVAILYADSRHLMLL